MDASIDDLLKYIAHRVNSRRSDSHYPRPIVCKFIRRLAKEEVMAHRNETSNLNPDDLDLSADAEITATS